MIPNLYTEGLVIEKMDSRLDWGDTDRDYVLKRLIVKAEQNVVKDWELIAIIEVEDVEIEDGEDTGSIDQPVEVYRMPFPFDLRTRIEMLRQIKKHPKFYVN